MSCKVHREVKGGRPVRLYLGVPEVDAYLDLLKCRRLDKDSAKKYSKL